MKKLLVLAIMALSSLSVLAYYYDAQISGIYYNFSGDEAEVTSLTSSSYSGRKVIPESVYYNGRTYSVTSIGDYAFQDCEELKSITLPNSVKTIGEYAFDGCSSLTSITIPESVTSIGKGAFELCSSLTSITIPNSVTCIGDNAFYGCTKLTSVNIPNSLTLFGRNVFDYCPLTYNIYDNAYYIGNNENPYLIFIKPNNGHVTSCEINESCKFIYGSNNGGTFHNHNSSYPNGCIDGGAFYDCMNLKSLTIPNSVTSIGDYAFLRCTGLTSVSIPNSVMSIGDYAFSGCTGLTSVSIPNSVMSIGDYAFSGCTGLTSITIPSSVTNIGRSAFSCPSLQNNEYGNACYIGNSENPYLFLVKATSKDITTCEVNAACKFIDENAFNNCVNLASVYITDLTAWCNISFIGSSSNPLSYGMYYDMSDEQRIPHRLYLNGQEITDLVIPEGVTSIGDYAFDGCSSLTSVTIPSSVTSIGTYAFYDCTSLVSVNIGENVTSIGSGAFQYMDRKIRDLSAKVYVNRGTDALLAVWNYAKSMDGYRTLPYETGTSQILYSPYLSTVSKTQTTITYRINNVYPDLVYECYANGNPLGNDEYIITGLRPEYKQGMSLTVRSANNTFSNRIKDGIKTISLSPTISNEGVTASSVSLKGSYTEGDANVISHSVVIDESEMEWEEGTLHGLDPNTSHNCKYIVVVKCEDGSTYSYEASKNIKTAELTLTTLQPKVISDGNVILAAQSNLDDEETNAGFEWRREDWTDDFDSKSGIAYIYEGMMEGYIRSINSNYLWKFRPYYTSNAGNTYYGEWKGLDPSDFSYFEPTVHTYSNINVNGNSAEVKGYAMRGTDKVTSQGFMYWKDDSSYSQRKKIASVPSDALTVIASGNIMTATLEDLDYESTYCYVAFVTTEEDETFFGEVQTFSTNGKDNGEEIEDDIYIDGIYYVFLENNAEVIRGDNVYSGSVVIPASVSYRDKTYSVTSIGESAFYGCHDLTSVTIPNSVTSIGNYAFAACESLKDVYCNAEKVPNAYSDTFFDTDVSQATLHVPGMCKEAYRTTSPWNQFGTIVSSSDEEPTITGMQLDNSSFDEWSIVSGSSGKDLYQPWGEGRTPYWDTNNTFATTLNVSNSTYTDEDGRRYASLQTKFLAVKLVAGAIFTGSYLEVDGTNSVISLGRPFTERPTKMKFDFQYHTSTINRTGGTWKDAWGDYVSQSMYESLKGQPDSCQIYIALGDWEPVDYVDKSGGTHTCPYLIRTRPSQLHLFDPNDPHIIGYAQMTCGKDISSWTTETMDIHYRSDRAPKYIIVYATSSKYGDFSTGGEMSELKLDNIELLYGSIPDIDPEPVDSIPGDGRTFVEKLANGVEMEFKVVSKEGKTCQVGSGTSNCIDPDTTGEITIPSEVRGLNVVAIGDNAFNQCNDLSSVTLPSSVTSIGQFAFKDCKLHNILIKCEMPPAIEENAFTNQTFYHAMLYIPTGSWDAYAYDDNWYRFINIRETATSEEQLSMQLAYTLMDASTFTYSVYDPVNNCIGTINSVSGINEDNPNHSWQMIEAGGAHYLYNIGAKKYVKRNGNDFNLTDVPEPIEVEDGDNGIILGAQPSTQWALVSNERMSVAQNAIEEVTAIVSSIGKKEEETVYSLSGQRQSTPKKGINIIGSKKVMIK